MPRFIQFLHPGGQPVINQSDHKSWNKGNHCRSFMSASGAYISALNQKKCFGNMGFWGEWESTAKCKEIDSIGEAHHVFFPVSTLFPDEPGLQNTDPYVFDGPFLYSCCKQTRKNGVTTYLRDLQKGDVIVFGSRVNHVFVFDTVFVVAESELFKCSQGPSQLSGRFPQSFIEATIKPLAHTHEGTEDDTSQTGCSEGDWGSEDEVASCSTLVCKLDTEFRLYTGATPDNPVNGMFSFAPAILTSSPVASFSRPSLENFVNHNMNMGFCDILRGKEETRDVCNAWQETVKSVLKAGLVLGCSFEIQCTQDTA
jgi:hypothetical protein